MTTSAATPAAPRSGAGGAWAQVIAYTALLYATLGWTPTVMPWAWLGRHAALLASALVGGLGLLSLLGALALHSPDRLRRFALTLPVLVAAAYVVFALPYVSKKMHVLIYAVMAVLLLRAALRTWQGTGQAYVAALILGSLIGWGDESIQALLPSRTYSLHDIATNVWSVAAALCVSALLRGDLRPRGVAQGGTLVMGISAVTLAWSLSGEAPLRTAPERAAQPLNVLLFTVDCLRADHLGCYGYARPTSPRIDAWSRGATTFTDAVAQASWTMPSLMSLLTGVNPPAHGVTSREARKAAGLDALPALFRRAGYDTPNVCFLTSEPSFADLGYPPAQRDSSISALRAVLSAPRTRPFFVWYHYREMHLPWNPSDAHLAAFTDPKRWSPAQRERLRVLQKRTIVPYGTARFEPEDHAEVRALYDAGVSAMDEAFGSVLDTLRDTGQLEHTIIVFTADHGDELFEHGWVGHASTTSHPTLYQEVLHVPLIIAAPGGRGTVSRIAERVRQIDVLPTLADLCGARPTHPPQGRSLLGAMRGEGLTPEPAYSETSLGGYRTAAGQQMFVLRCLQDGPWKRIEGVLPEGPVQALYNLRDDPREQIDVTARYPHETQRLSGLLRETVDTARKRWVAPSEPPSVVWKGPAPTLLSPSSASPLRFEDAGGRVRLAVEGPAFVDYEVAYQVGRGLYRVEGTLFVRGNRPEFGPLPKKTWNTLVEWNPFRFRFRVRGAKNVWSPWYAFTVAPVEGAR